MNFEKTKTYKCFKKSKYLSIKHKNYFYIYDKLFEKYRNRNITFVEIGIFSGGSLFMWRNFFGNKARIIGIDLNPEAKKFEKYGFEIIIGDQSSEVFWKNFFTKFGKADLVLDDGGHTNYQQIITTNCCIPNIKDDGMLIVEDVHTSFIKHNWYNPSKYSYINYCKKLIEDINFRFPGLKKHIFSLNKYIHSIEFYESIVAYKINRKLCKTNKLLSNSKKTTHPKEFRNTLKENGFFYKIKKILNTKSHFTYIIFLINSFKSKKFFK
tara:strand:+ start:152 stop:952 length:801 start_codon:yes stop_codon:yes gene_type:complete